MLELIENFFTEEVCTDAIKEINLSQSLWQKCADTNMYVLGNSFLRNQTQDYFNKHTIDSATVELFRKKISSLFQQEVKFCQTLSRPGFQIIKRNESDKPCVWHYDTILVRFPYNRDFLDYENFDNYFENYYVFGLMLSKGLSSFDYFPETQSNFSSIKSGTPLCENHHDLVGDECGNPDCKLIKFNTVEYTQGSLLIQSKKILHRVGIKDIDGTKEQRMTLQGYGVVKNDIMYLIW